MNVHSHSIIPVNKELALLFPFVFPKWNELWDLINLVRSFKKSQYQYIFIFIIIAKILF